MILRTIRRILPLVVLGAVTFFRLENAWAWGANGHRLVNRVAAESMTSSFGTFLNKNIAKFQDMATIPDAKWKQVSTYNKERFSHFFQWDVYQQTALENAMPILIQKALEILDKSEFVANGTAVWRADQLFNMLVKAIDDKDWPRVLQLAGTMGHYVGDLSQPMHVTEDYDGQSIGRRGIHAMFETEMVNKQDPDTLHQQVYDAAQRLRRSTNQEDELLVVNIGWSEGKRSLAKLPSVLQKFTSTEPNEDGLVKDIIGSIADGAKTLALVLDKACEQARHCSNFPRSVQTVTDPEWIPVEIQNNSSY